MVSVLSAVLHKALARLCAQRLGDASVRVFVVVASYKAKPNRTVRVDSDQPHPTNTLMR
jgi:hypothetical protein